MEPSRETCLERVDIIHVGERLRQVDGPRVDALAESMKEIGLMVPITLRLVETMVIDGVEESGVPVLIAGETRLSAAKKLGWEKIPAIYLDADENEAIIWECDENLVRTELTTEEKRKFLRARKEAWERLQAEKNQVGNDFPPEIGYKVPPPQKKGFAEETAAATGLSKRRINQLLADPKPRPEPPKPVAPGTLLKTGFDASESRIEKAQRAYLALSDEERRAFKEWLDQPVFDSTAAA